MSMNIHSKNFNVWNNEKQKINSKEISEKRFFHEGEIWWGSLGVNIGSEQDGKNRLFERPLLIIKKFHKGAIWITPLTGKYQHDKFHYYINATGSCAMLSQLRLISTKRMIRYIKTIKRLELVQITAQIKNMLP